jgi:hypothetical protein
MEGWRALGEVLGGNHGIDRQGAYEEGRLRTAQTENALLQARERQLNLVTQEAQRKAIEDLERIAAEQGVPRAPLYGGIARAGGGNSQQLASALLGMQEFDLRNRASAPDATNRDRNTALAGVASGPVSPFQAVGAGGYADMFADTPTIQNTPLGESLIGENVAQASAADALATLRNTQAAAGGFNPNTGAGAGPGGIGKPPSGFILNPEYDPEQPIGANRSNYPYLDARQPVMGSREATFFNRVAGSASAMQADVANLMKMPVGTNIGILGVGPAATPQTSAPAAISGALKYKLSGPEARMYNKMLGGMNRALGFIEGQGLAGSNALAESYDTLLLRPGDTLEDTLFALAQIKQTVVQGLQPHLNSNRTPQPQYELLVDIIRQLNESVPFEVEDVIDLVNGQNPNAIRAAAERRFGGQTPGGRAGGLTPDAAPAAPAAPAPAAPSGPVTISSDAEYNTLPSGTVFVAPDGSTRRKP